MVLRMNLGAFLGEPSRDLTRLVGESERAGSTFSLSKSSSKKVGARRRLDGEDDSCLPEGDAKEKSAEGRATGDDEYGN